MYNFYMKMYHELKCIHLNLYDLPKEEMCHSVFTSSRN